VSFVIQKSPGASDINVSATTFELIGPGGTDRFPFENSTAVSQITVLQDNDDSLATSSSGHILNSRTDRLVVTLNMTGFATEPGFDNAPLEPGDTATIRVNTESGATSIIRIQVPQSLSGEDSVEL
jgi:archaellin